MFWRAILMCLVGLPAAADTVVAARTIRANAIISELDVMLSAAQMPNGFARAQDVIGQEARVVLYAGRPIYVDDIGPPALVTRISTSLLSVCSLRT